MIGSSSGVVRAGCAALPECTDTTTCVDEYTEGDILDQFETFNGMPVYYGCDLHDSEYSDWDDPYAIASAAYVEDYNFDVPEGIDLTVWPYGSDIRQDRQTGLTPVCQTLLGDTPEELDSMDVNSLTKAFTEDVQDTDDLYQRIVSSDEEDFGEDLEMNTWAGGVVPHLGPHMARFRRKCPIHGRRLCSVTSCFQRRS